MPFDSLVPPDPVRWTLVARPFSTDRQEMLTPCGLTLAQMLELSDLPQRYWPYIQVFVDDEEVPRQWWRHVRPKPKAHLFVRVNAMGGGGGGGKNPLAIIASIAVIAFAAWAAPMLTAAIFGVEAAAVSAAGVFTAMGLTKLVIAGAITMIGSLLVNAIAPTPKPVGDAGLTNPAFSITGTSNRLNPYGAIPRVLGRRRLFPVLAANPYTETVGNERYMRLLLLVGYGPLDIDDLRIGSTPISAFDGAEVEIREGWANDPAITLYTQRIEEDPLSISLTVAGGWRTITSRQGAREISLDISFDRGLAYYNDQGGRSNATVAFEAQYRKIGAANWEAIPWKPDGDAGFETAGVITITDQSSSPVRRGGRFSTPEVGQYEIRLRRTSADATSQRLIDTATVSALRTITDDPPVTMQGLSMIALRLKAYEQINNQLQQISCVATSYLQVWDGADWSWELSRNPAWAYCDILRRRGGAELIPDGRIDLSAIKEWAQACDSLATDGSARWVFDGVIEGGSVVDALRDVSSHARARYGLRDGKHSIVRDIPQSVPVLHITPRNSYGYSGRKQFIDLPHALKVRFINPDKEWQEDERIVYADGYGADNAERFETVDMMGCTSPEQAWREGRYHLAVGKLRPETHEVFQDVEALRASDGDLVMFAHDVMMVGLGWGRIKAQVLNAGMVSGLQLDEPANMAAGKSYALRIRRADGSSQVLPLVTLQGNNHEVTLVTALPESLAPEPGNLFQFGEAGREAAPMLVKGIEPGPNLSAKLILIPAAPAVHEADTGLIPDFDSYITRPAKIDLAPPPAPQIWSVVSDESVLVRGPDGRSTPRILVRLYPPASSAVNPPEGIEVRFRESESAGPWSAIPTQPADTLIVGVQPVEDGVSYDLRLRFVSASGIASDWTEVSGHRVVGRTTPPGSVTGFVAERRADGVQLTWEPVSALDLIGYEIREGSAWDGGSIVTTRYRGTTIFVALTDATERFFHIKAIDEVGLFSQSAASVSAAVSAPTAVTVFDVIPQGDHVRASWEPVDGSGIEYELRAGPTWGTGRFVGRAAGNHLVALWPIREAIDETFWIKSVSSAGLYSDMAAVSTTRLAPLTGRNAVLTSDRQALNWTGVQQGMEVIGGNLLALARSNGANLPRGEYVFPVDLSRSWRARNWVDARIATAPANDLTWADATFRWEDSEAASAWLPLGDVDGATLRSRISIEAAIPNDLIEGFRLAGNVTGVKGMAASQSLNLGYAPARFDQGLRVGNGAKAKWPVNIPSEFSSTFDVRLDTLLDEPVVYLALTGDKGALRLIWSPDISAFALEDDYGRRVVTSLVRRAGDLITFGICQTPTTRRLFAASIQTGVIASGSQPFTPLGAFTSAQLHPA